MPKSSTSSAVLGVHIPPARLMSFAAALARQLAGFCLALGVSLNVNANQYGNYADIPTPNIVAPFFWVPDGGSGCTMPGGYYKHEPGYSRIVGYPGFTGRFLVPNFFDVEIMLRAIEQNALANPTLHLGGGWYRESLTRDFTLTYDSWGTIYDPSWITVEKHPDGSQRSGGVRCGTQSGRACPNGYYSAAWTPYGFGWAFDFFCILPPGHIVPEANLGPRCALSGGSPVNAANGNLYSVTNVSSDFSSPAPLALSYNSLRQGRRVTHTYSSQLSSPLDPLLQQQISPGPFSDFPLHVTINVNRPDGSTIRFTNSINWQSPTTTSPTWTPEVSAGYQLVSRYDGTGSLVGLELSDVRGRIERFGVDGRLTSVTTSGGETYETAYDQDGRLATVTNDAGRALTFSYDANDELVSVSNDANESVLFAYDALSNLTEVIFPDDTPGDGADNPRRIFHFEDTTNPNHLTGITDERGVRIATWGYDPQGRVITSEEGGGANQFDVTYNQDGTTTVTDPLGQQRTFTLTTQRGIAKVASIIGGDCSGCSADAASYAYDTNGYVASKTDFNGNVTNYVRDDVGRELSRTEAAGTPQARTITTTWHTDFSKPLTIKESGRITTYTYDTEGRVLSSTVGSQP